MDDTRHIGPASRDSRRTTHTKQRRLTSTEIDAQIPAARARDAAARKAGMRAVSARYDSANRRILMQLTSEYLIGVPVSKIPELRGATDRQLSKVTLSPAGSGLHWKELDMDLSVAALVLSAIPAVERMREMGRVAGRVRSEVKAAASRANGAKGGRPRAETRSHK